MPCLILKKTSRRTQAVVVSEGIFCAARCCVIFYLRSMKVYLHMSNGNGQQNLYAQHSVTKNLLYSSIIEMQIQCSYCVCVVFSSHSFWTSSSLDVLAEVTQVEGHTGFLIHLLSAVRDLIFLARRIHQPFLSLVDHVCVCVFFFPPHSFWTSSRP